MLWDTGSDYFLLGVDYCSNCEYYHFRSDQSTTYTVLDYEDYTQYYADGTMLSGEFVSDQVCMTSANASCASAFEWVAIKTQSGLGDIMDGIIGLMSGSDGNTDPLYMYHAYDQGLLNENTFSIFLTTA